MSLSEKPGSDFAPWVDLLERKIASIRFGSIQIVVHEGRITQIESTEKIRIQSDPREAVRRLESPGGEGR
jgi:hypothetical protein